MRQPLPMIYGLPTIDGSHLLTLSAAGARAGSGSARARSEDVFVEFETNPVVDSTVAAGIHNRGQVVTATTTPTML